MPPAPLMTWDVRQLVTEFETPTGVPWSEQIGDLWRDRSSRKRVGALVNDIAHRGHLVIPVHARWEDGGRVWRITDGVHRIAAAWALMQFVPVKFIEGES
ncbi:hypothetical protein [Rhodococcus rhodochrous]|uniref:hypothetical protein n=1 Tax=Rhodococcus rhodochrous TaxID=1829 RepID=UPI00177E4F34|nr:hypothetical protein [Rhodococcus rhodochrous]